VRGPVIPGIEARRIPDPAPSSVRRERGQEAKLMTLPWFGTLDAMKAFMGGHYEVAHVPARALANFGRCSARYEVPGRRDQLPVTSPAVRAP
jgi:hypothetical protein